MLAAVSHNPSSRKYALYLPNSLHAIRSQFLKSPPRKLGRIRISKYGELHLPIEKVEKADDMRDVPDVPTY